MVKLNEGFAKVLGFGFAFNIVLYLFQAFQFCPNVTLPFTDLSVWTNWFDLSPFNIMFAAGSVGVIYLASLLMRSGTYPIYAMLLAGLTMLIGPIQNIFMAIPNTFAAIIPDAMNPNPALFPENPIIIVIRLVFVFIAYWFIFGLVIQRDV